MNIVLIAGSNTGRKTRGAIDIAAEAFKDIESDIDLQVFDLKEIDHQLADGRNYLDYGGDMTEIASAIMQADALVIGFPVFQAGIPAALKNVLDLLPRRALMNKAVSIIVTAGSNYHQLVAEYQLRPILDYLKAHVVPSYVFINERHFDGGKIISDDVKLRIHDLARDTLLLGHGLEAMKQKEEDLLGF